MSDDTVTRGEIADLVSHTKEAYLPQRPLPERRKGSAQLCDLESFIAHTKRHQDADSAIFADPGNGALTPGNGAKLSTVFDYNREGAVGEARWGQHRAVYAFPFSEEWLAWVGSTNKDFGQQGFAEFMEDRLADVLEARTAGPGAKAIASTLGVDFANPAKILEVSRGLAINVDRRVSNHVNVANGTSEFIFAEEHTGAKGGTLSVPGAFLIGIPVFKSGTVYQIPVRLRYRVRDSKISWRFELYRTDRVFDDAFGESAKKAQVDTGLPLFFGKPEV